MDRECEAPEARHVEHRRPLARVGDVGVRGEAVLREVGERADDDEALGPGEAVERRAEMLAHGAAAAVAADEPGRLQLPGGRAYGHGVAALLRETHLRMRERLQLLVEDRRQAVLLEMKAVRVGREVGDQAEIPLDDHAFPAVADLPARHLDADLVHRLGDAEGREHLERRRMERPGALIQRQRRLGLDHLHRHALVRERERRGEADGTGADNEDRFHARKKPRGAACRRSKPSRVTRISSPTCTPAGESRLMTFGCTTTVMFSSSVMSGSGPAGRLLVPTMGWK